MQILGPVSQVKLLELIEKGSLHEEDEVTSGNGYWFSIRENDLVEKYLIGQEAQTFNPISEAPTVLALGSTVTSKPKTPAPKLVLRAADEVKPVAVATNSDADETISPAAEDLEYPDLGEVSPPVVEPPEVVEEIEVEAQEEIEEEIEIDQLIPEKPQAPAPAVLKEIPCEEVAVPIPETNKKVKKNRKNQKIAKKNDRYLFVLLALVLILIGGIIYYYRLVINKPLPGFETSFLMNSAYAQGEILSPTTKKKTLTAIPLSQIQ